MHINIFKKSQNGLNQIYIRTSRFLQYCALLCFGFLFDGVLYLFEGLWKTYQGTTNDVRQGFLKAFVTQVQADVDYGNRAGPETQVSAAAGAELFLFCRLRRQVGMRGSTVRYRLSRFRAKFLMYPRAWSAVRPTCASVLP
jgi:hypothetical protein